MFGFWKGTKAKLLPSTGIEFSDGRIKTYASGSPEGAITATVGSEYTDTATGILYLKTSGSGNTGWTAISTTSGGKIIQLQSTTKTSNFSGSSSSYADITGLSVSITPSSSSNTVFILATVNGAVAGAAYLQLVRDSTAIALGDAASSRTRSSSANMSNIDGGASSAIVDATINFLDSPATTSATTYKIQYISPASATLYVNRGVADNDNTSNSRTISTITVMEVAV